MHSTLLVRYSQIGDALIAFPVVYSVAKKCPNDTFTVLTNPKFRGIFRQMPSNVSLLPMVYRKRNIPLRGLVHLFCRYRLLLTLFFSRKYDRVALLQEGTFEKQLRFLLQLRGSRVEQIDLRDFLSPEKLQKREYFQTPSINQCYIATLERLGYQQVQNEFPATYYKGERQTLALQQAKPPYGKPYVGLAPFSRIPSKMYPLEKMEQVLAYLQQQSSVQILVFGGGEEEQKHAQSWEARYPNVTSLIGKLSFDDELSVITACSLMVSMDSANLHMAALVNTPAVSIWGPSHPGMGYYPYNVSVDYAIQKDLPCRPCSFWGEAKCTASSLYECMDIAPSHIVDRVVAALEDLKKKSI